MRSSCLVYGSGFWVMCPLTDPWADFIIYHMSQTARGPLLTDRPYERAGHQGDLLYSGEEHDELPHEIRF
jgi:hypothetical protein